MRYFNINVNGNQYSVAVEEIEEPKQSAPSSMPAPPQNIEAPKMPASDMLEGNGQGIAVSTNVPGEGEPVKAPMPGTILDVKVSKGEMVQKGQALVVLEAMKMENDIVALKDGIVTSIIVKKGDTVESNAILLTIS